MSDPAIEEMRETAEHHLARGNSLMRNGEPGAATLEFRSAASVLSQLGDRDRSDLSWSFQEAHARRRLGEALAAQERYDEALSAFDAIDSIVDEIMKHEGDDPNLLEMIADASLRRGSIHLQMGDLDRARNELGRALEHCIALAKGGVSVDAWWEELSRDYELLARARARQGNMSAAVDATIASASAAQRREVSGSASVLLTRARSLRLDAESSMGSDPDEGISTLQRVIALTDRASRIHPPLPEMLREATLAHVAIATFQESQGNVLGALRQLQEALDLAQRLAAADRYSVPLQQDLSLVRSRIEALTDRGRAGREGSPHAARSVRRIYLAHSGDDVRSQRASVLSLLQRLDGIEVRSVETFSAVGGLLNQTVADSDLAVFLLGERPGASPSPADPTPTMTEYEFDLARQAGVEVFAIALRSEGAEVDRTNPSEDQRRWKKFLDRAIADADHRLVYPEDLEAATHVMMIRFTLREMAAQTDVIRQAPPASSEQPLASAGAERRGREIGPPVCNVLYDGVLLEGIVGTVCSPYGLGFDQMVGNGVFVPRSAFDEVVDPSKVIFRMPSQDGQPSLIRAARILWRSPAELADAVLFEVDWQPYDTLEVVPASALFDYAAPRSERPALSVYARATDGSSLRGEVTLAGAVAPRAPRAPEIVEFSADSRVSAGSALCPLGLGERIVAIVRTTQPTGFRPRNPPLQIATSMRSIRDAISRTMAIYDRAREWSDSGKSISLLASRRRLSEIEAQLAAEPVEPWVAEVVHPYLAASRAAHARTARRLHMVAAACLALLPLVMAFVLSFYVKCASWPLSAPGLAAVNGPAPAHRGAIKDIAVTDDGRLAVTLGGDDMVRLWDLDAGTMRWEYQMGEPFAGVVFNRTSGGGADAVQIIDGADDRPVFELDMSKGEVIGPPGTGGRVERVDGVPTQADANLGLGVGAIASETVLMSRPTGHVSFTRPAEWATLPAHRAPVTALAMTRDGERAATAAADGEVLLWSRTSAAGADGGEWKAAPVTSNFLVASIGALPIAMHGNPVTGVEYSPTGERLLTFGADHVVHVLDAVSREELFRLAGHTDRITTVQFNADASRIATHSLDGTTRLWDAATGRQIVVLTAPNGKTSAAAFGPDPTRLVTADTDGQLHLWDAVTGALRSTITASPDQPINAVRFSADGELLVAGGEDRVARIWNAGTGAPRSRFISQAAIKDVQINADGSRLMILSGDGTMSLRDTRTESIVASMPAVAASFSPDGRRLATSTADGTVSLFTADAGKLIADAADPRAGARQISFSSDGRLLAAVAARPAATNPNVELFDGVTLAPRLFLASTLPDVVAATLSPDGRYVAVVTANSIVQYRTSQAVCAGPCTSVTFSRDGSLLLSAGLAGGVGINRVASGERLADARYGGSANVVRFRGASNEFVSAGDDGVARIWLYEAAGGSAPDQIRLRASVRGHAAGITHAEIAANGRVLVTGDIQGGARVVDLDRATRVGLWDVIDHSDYEKATRLQRFLGWGEGWVRRLGDAVRGRGGNE